MDCPECGAETVAFAVPADLREHAPEGAPAAAICSRCLSVSAAGDLDRPPDFGSISDAFPDGPAAVPMALLLGLLDSLALNRRAIADLLERVEGEGADAMLVIDRLAGQPTVQAEVDLSRRRHQLGQLLE